MVDGLGKMTIDSPLDKEGFHRQVYIKFQYHHRGVPSHNVSRYSEEPTSYTPYRLRPLASQTEETSKSLQDQSCLKHSEEQSCAEDMTQGNSGSKYFKLEPSGHSWFNLDQTSSKTRRQHQPGVKKCEQDILKIPSSWPFRTQPQLSESDVNDIKRTVRSRPCLTPLRGDIKSKINTSHPGHSFQVVSAPLSSITSDKDQIPLCINKSKDKAMHSSVIRNLTYPVVHMLDENNKQNSMPDHIHSDQKLDRLDSFLSTTQCIRPTNDSMINEQLQPPKYIPVARKEDKEQKQILGKSKRFGITRCNTFCQEGISLKRKESKSPFRPASTSSWRGKHMHMRFLDKTYSEINQSDPDYFSNYLLSVSRPSLASRPNGKPLRLATPNHTSCSIDAPACAGVNDTGEPQHAQYSKDSSAKNDCENESEIKKNVGKSQNVQDNSHVDLNQTFLPTGRTLKTPGHPITNHTTVVHADINGVNEKCSEKIESLPQSRYIQTETDSQNINDKYEMFTEKVHFEDLCAGQSRQGDISSTDGLQMGHYSQRADKDDANMAQNCKIGITDQISNVNQHRNTEHGGDYLPLTNKDYGVYESDSNSCFRHCIDSNGLLNEGTASQSVDMAGPPHPGTCCRKESVAMDDPLHPGTCCRKVGNNGDNELHQINTYSDKRRFEQTSCVTGKCEAIEDADVTMDNADENDTNTGLHSFPLEDKLSCESEHSINSMDGDELCQADDDFEYDFYSPLPERCTKGKQSGCTSHGKNLVLTRLRDWAAMARTKQQIDSKSSGCSINVCTANMAGVSHAIDSVPIVDTSQYHMFARKNTLNRRKI